jgi:hypothetical protein
MLVFRYQGLVPLDKFRTPWFPVLPLVFVLSSGFIAYRAADYFLFMVESMELLRDRFFMGLSIATAFVVLTGVIVALRTRKNDSADG